MRWKMITNEFDIFSKETQTKALKVLIFNVFIYASILYFGPSRSQLVVLFSFLIVFMTYYRLKPITDYELFAKETIKSLVYLYIFVAVLNFVAVKLLVYGVLGYGLFIFLYVAYILFRRRKLFISGIDQIIDGLKKVKKVEVINQNVGKKNDTKSSDEHN
jgi:hypothetical protein